MKNIKKIILITVTAFSLFALFVLYGDTRLLIKANSSSHSSFNFSEKYINESELVSSADIIIEGIITDKTKEIIYETTNVKAPVSFYKVKVSEAYKTEDSIKKHIYINFGGTNLPEGLDFGTNYVLYLVKSGLEINGDDAYCFVSLQQGALTVMEETAMNKMGGVTTIATIKSNIEKYSNNN